MKLDIGQFKSQKDLKLEIPEQGWTLLHGKSGCGKSTIMNAIHYALYGEEKKSSRSLRSSVYLEFQGYTFSRKNGKLISPQVFPIDAKIFEIAGYLDQKSTCNFLAIAPIERLRFLELLCPAGIGDTLDKIKKEKKSVSQELMYVKGQCSIVHHRTDIEYSPQKFRETKDELTRKKLENEKSLQAIKSIQEIDKKLGGLEKVDLKTLRTLNMINKGLDVTCPSCHTHVGRELSKQFLPHSLESGGDEFNPEKITSELVRLKSIYKEIKDLERRKEFMNENVLSRPHDLESLESDFSYLTLFSKTTTATGGDVKESMETLTHRLDGLDNLSQCVSQAQNIFYTKGVEHLSSLSNEFLAGFFPFPVKLSFGIGKRGLIDFKLVFNGRDADLKSLSGGEYDRVLLAITLSLNKMYTIPFILLDETLGSLDAHSMHNVVQTVKKLYSGFVVYIGHTDDYVLFDNVIKVD
jgi:DNA repair exonuclease SbcCD ATPase subunit